MDLLQSMNEAMKYIEENLADEIDFREVAKRAYSCHAWNHSD